MLQVHPVDGTAEGRLYRSISTIRNTSTIAYCYNRSSYCRESHREQTTILSVPRHRSGTDGNIIPHTWNKWPSEYAIPCAISGCPTISSSYYAPYWDEFYAGLAMTASGIGLLLVSRNIRTDGKVP